MDLIRHAIYRPTAVIAAVVMVMMFGLVALFEIPIQLTPDVRKPVINVQTAWPGAAPADLEREILNRQEDAFKGLEGLRGIEGRARPGRADITLEFAPGMDMDKSMMLVANRLDRVIGYPDEADKPALSTSGTEDNAIAWFVILRTAGNTTPVDSYGTFVDDVVRDRIERVAGISAINVYGGAERELQVVIDPDRMSQYGLTVPEVINSLRNASVSLTAGNVDEGKRRYVVRVEGTLITPEQVGDVVIRAESFAGASRLARVRLSDIAKVGFGFKEITAVRGYLGEEAILFNALRESGANVIGTMEEVRTAVAELNAGPLKAEGLTIRQIYDETVYIQSAIDLVIQNIYVGGTLAAIILMLFLRSWGATLVISLAIPVSVVGAFVGMTALGRSLNVISLAGIAFSVGMVVDAAIVVLENVYRLRQEGVEGVEAAYKGAKQVWGAILVSALTTVMVFIPILGLQLEVGQLFRDIAVAISVAVTLSLVVAVTVVPALARKFLKDDIGDPEAHMHIGLLDGPAHAFVAGVLAFTRSVIESRIRAVIVICSVVAAAVFVTWVMLPDAEYLPRGNRNMIQGFITPPPGYNLETTLNIVKRLEGAARPYWASVSGPDSVEGQPPKMQDFFYYARDGFAFIGGTSVDPARAGELEPIFKKSILQEPGIFGSVRQPHLFGRSVGGGRTVDVNITGGDLETILGVALKATGLILKQLPRQDGHGFRPRPGLELGAPEVRIVPDPVLLEDAGVSAKAFAQTVDAFNGGLRVGQITVDGRRMDLTLIGAQAHVTSTQDIENLPVVTASGQILPVRSLGSVEVTAGPVEIRHIERERAVTLQVEPNDTIALEAAMRIIRTEVVDKLQAEGLPQGVKIHLSGTADSLTQTWNAMVWQLALALAIVYLVMAVLFESFLYPLIIMVTVPLASAGAVAALGLLNMIADQKLDMLTMLGFVILIGIVVNNAILLVHQTLFHIREEGMDPRDSIIEATRNRIRPIFMSTITSLFGMLPLVVFPGAGSELYRGLGTVVLGGLALSAVLTLLIIPPLLSLVMGYTEGTTSQNM